MTGPSSLRSLCSKAPNKALKNAIVKQIANSLRSPSLIKSIANDVYDVIAEKLEEQITEKVYQAVSMDLEKYKDEVGAITQRMNDMKKEIIKLQDEKDDAEQYSRRNCLRIYGVPENPGENTDRLVLDIFNEKLGLTVSKEALDRSHRIPARNAVQHDQEKQASGDVSTYADAATKDTRRPKSRPIIVKFSRYNVRSEIYRVRTKLKNVDGPMIYIKEDLTAKRASLLHELIKSKKSKSCWTQDGNIFALDPRNSKKTRIKTMQDLENL